MISHAKALMQRTGTARLLICNFAHFGCSTVVLMFVIRAYVVWLFHGGNTDEINNKKLIVRLQQSKLPIDLTVDHNLHYSKSSAFQDSEMEQNSVVERKYILPCSYGVFYVQIEDLKLSSVHSSRKAGTIYVLPCQKQISGRVIMFANGKTTW